MFPVAEKTDMGQSISEMELKDKAKKENEGEISQTSLLSVQ